MIVLLMTQAVCCKILKKDNRLKVFKNKKNIGLTKSLNILLQHASGDLIARQDDDDVSNIDRIQAQVDLWKKIDWILHYKSNYGS